MSNKILFLDAGHGGIDNGANGVNNSYEKKLTNDLTDRIYHHAKTYKMNVQKVANEKNTYETNFYKTFYNKNCQVLEIHFNSSTNVNANGTELLIDDNFSINDVDDIDKALLKSTSKFFKNRGYKLSQLKNSDYCRINGVGYRLLEVCFISNREDYEIYINNIDSIALEIINNIYKYFGGKKPDSITEYAKIINSTSKVRYGGTHTIEFTSQSGIYKDKKISKKDSARDFLPGERVSAKPLGWIGKYYVYEFYNKNGVYYFRSAKRKV